MKAISVFAILTIFLILRADAQINWGRSPNLPLTLQEVKVHVADFSPPFSIPIEITENVVTELNIFITHPVERKRLRDGLLRFYRHRSEVDKALQKESVPLELDVIPLASTDFQPDFASANEGAGAWHITEFTANLYGISVNDSVDERRDLSIATRGISHYLFTLLSMFHDWQLVILAYGLGEGAVQEYLARPDHLTALQIDKIFYPSHSKLARATALMIVIKDPSFVGLAY